MSFSSFLRIVASEADSLEIVEYYEKVDGLELADRFVSELDRFIKFVSERPDAFAEIHSGLRRANLKTFPHHIIFEVVDEKTIIVLTIKHDRRHPDLGLNR